MTDVLRVGILGAGRGASLGAIIDMHPRARVVALCDSDPIRQDRGAAWFAHLETRYTEYNDLLGHGLDIVVVANDALAHVPLAIQALEAGIHVLSEVMACRTVAEAVALARAVEASRASYCFAENACWLQPVLEMKRLFRAGALGTYLYGECEYVHDCTGGWPRMSRGDPRHWRNWIPATGYCSHALGPILDITGTRPVRCVGMTTPNRLGREVGRTGDDMGVVLCQMDNGAVTKLLVGLALRREPVTHWYSLYGTSGQIENARGLGEERVNVFLASDPEAPYGRSYTPAFPRQIEWARGASDRGGADAQMIDAYLRAILDGVPPPIDVYAGLDMTLPGILGYRSAFEGSVPLEVPDMRDESVRARYEDDHWAPGPDGEGLVSVSPSAHGHVEIAPEVYEAQRARDLDLVKDR